MKARMIGYYNDNRPVELDETCDIVYDAENKMLKISYKDVDELNNSVHCVFTAKEYSLGHFRGTFSLCKNPDDYGTLHTTDYCVFEGSWKDSRPDCGSAGMWKVITEKPIKRIK